MTKQNKVKGTGHNYTNEFTNSNGESIIWAVLSVRSNKLHIGGQSLMCEFQ